MLWATSLAQSVSANAFVEALGRHGFQPATGAPPIGGLRVFEHGETGHRVIYVARTGRIQIRLDPLTSHDDRTRAAEVLYEHILAAGCEVTQLPSQAETASGA